jgi:uncharacterized protein YbjT (DUF2867 family)
MRIVVLGGTGLVGSKVVSALLADGHEAVAAAPSTGVDAVTGEGLAEALTGASVVVDVSNSPSTEADAATEFFHRSTTRLLAAEVDARVGHHVVLSVVGAERMAPQSGYLRAKMVQEQLAADGPIPYTIVHATQFFEYLRTVADAATVDGTVRLPPVLIQPMAAADVALALVGVALGEPRHGVVEVGGPRNYVLPELIRTALVARGDTRSVVVDPSATYVGVHVDERTLIPGADAVAHDVRFEDWIIETAARG